MKRFVVLILMLFCIVFGYSQTTHYSRVEIRDVGNEEIKMLAAAGIAVEEGYLRKDGSYICELSGKEMLKVEQLGFQFNTLIDDISRYYVEKNIGLPAHVDAYRDTDEWSIPEDFEFGSMGGHCTFNEVINHIDNMRTKYPTLITEKQSIGQSLESREIWMVKISDNPDINEPEPEILYTSLIHAREPAGVMTLLFYMYYLLENYNDDPYIQYLVDNTQMYFVLVANPDGYVYNQTTNPNGGGMWRKNRRNSGGGCWGVDQNRNFGYKWGNDNNGSSPDPCDETYRGTAPFSEPENAALRDFCEAHAFKFCLNYHTYSNLLLYPWGYTSDPCPDDELFYAFSKIMTRDNNYIFGPGSTTIYPTNGGSDDWMYGEQTTKPLIYAFTPELGSGDDGFWCSINRIIPIARENMIMNISAAAFTLNYATLDETSPTLTGQLTNYLSFDITRLGLQDDGIYTVSLTPVSPYVTSVGSPLVFENLGMLETKTDSIMYTLEGISPGTPFNLLLTVNNGAFNQSDTITKVYGEPVILFYHDCNSLSNWNPGNWDVTTATYYSAPGCITDSKNGNYQNNQTNIIQLSGTLDLTNAAYAQLSFRAKWAIEPGYDYVQVLASSGSGWTALDGKYTVTGTSYQASGQPVYDGFQSSWVLEEINLDNYLGDVVSFRFMLKSDVYVVEDGFYFDDFTVTVVDISTGVSEKIVVSPEDWISSPNPNPVHQSTLLHISNHAAQLDNATLRIFTATGQLIKSIDIDKGVSSLNISTVDWQSGIYFYRLEGNGMYSETIKMVVF